MAYSTITKPGLHFNTKLYTGNSSTNAITGVGFQPDWLWIKNRSGPYYHYIQDAVRTSDNVVFSNGTDAAQDYPNAIQSFDTDGFTTGSQAATNNNNDNFVSWNWKANGSGSSNTDGAITSTVSANTTAGFSIVTWTADGGNSSGVGHGLGTTPKIIIYKSLGTGAWYAWLNQIIDTSQDYLLLNATDAKSDISGAYGTPSNTTISNFGFSNGSNLLAYCFAEKKGYSKFGRYTGNGSADGTFVYTGFKPAWVMIKRSSHNGTSWEIRDNKRQPHPDGNAKRLFADSTVVESSNTEAIEKLSNGFKIRSTGGGHNTSGNTYIYMAFAEEPLVANVGNGIPATAR
jgi:hypothetical protein